MCWTSARHSHFSSLNFIFFPHAGTAFLQSMDALLIKWVIKHFVLCSLFTITPSSSVKAVIRSYFNWNWINGTLLFPSPTSPSLFWQFVMRASGYDLRGKKCIPKDTFPRMRSQGCIVKDAVSRALEMWSPAAGEWRKLHRVRRKSCKLKANITGKTKKMKSCWVSSWLNRGSVTAYQTHLNWIHPLWADQESWLHTRGLWAHRPLGWYTYYSVINQYCSKLFGIWLFAKVSAH